MHRSLKGKLVIGGVVLALAACAGGAYAATQNSGPSTRQAFLNDVAKRLHVTPQQLSQALNGAFDDQLQAAVKAGRLTQAQANALKQRLNQKGNVAPVLPFGPRLARPRLPGPGFGFGLGRGPFAGPGALAPAAKYLGISNAQLFQQLSGGKSLAQIAAAHGKSVSGLEQALTTAAKARLDKAVAAKLISSAQEQRILTRLKARVSAEVNQKGFAFRRMPGPRLRFRGGVPAPPNAPNAVPPALPLPNPPLAPYA